MVSGSNGGQSRPRFVFIKVLCGGMGKKIKDRLFLNYAELFLKGQNMQIGKVLDI